MNNLQQNYTGQTLTQTVYINGSLTTNPQITIAREPFLLERHHFDKLLKDDNYFNKISDALIGSTLALLINMFAKLVGNKINSSISFDEWEVYAFYASAFLMIVSLLISKHYPSERKSLIVKIKKHFNEN